jgi:acyl-CoA dehydrogenase
MEVKLLRAKFFMERIMPETRLRLARITAGGGTMMALDPEQF